MLGEELRLLYVATTRAQDTLILTAGISEKKFESQWKTQMAIDENKLLGAGSFADWAGMWFGTHCSAEQSHAGKIPLIRWQVWNDAELVALAESDRRENSSADEFAADDSVWNELEQRLRWKYPFAVATERAAKVSVTTLRHEAMDIEAEEESEALFQSQIQNLKSKNRRTTSFNATTAGDVGTAHHKFLQFVLLDQTGSAVGLQSEIERMEREKILLQGEIGLLDINALGSFWATATGRNIREHSKFVHRELEFQHDFQRLSWQRSPASQRRQRMNLWSFKALPILS
jgi:ATP-dependent helicase/nuclease subunit A